MKRNANAVRRDGIALFLAGAVAAGMAGCPEATPKPETAKDKKGGPPLGPGDTEVEVTGPAAGGAGRMTPIEKESPPAPGPVRDAKFPPLVKTKLKNGLEVVTVENHELPVVSLSLVFRSGSAMDPADLPGLADFTGEIMKRGTTSRTAEQIADEIESVGGSLWITTDQDATHFGFKVLAPHLDTGLGLLADVVLNPSWADTETEKYRAKTLEDLKDMLSQPSFLAGRTLARALYGTHPYGTIAPTPDSVKKIDKKAMLAFHDKHHVAANAFVVVAGDVTSADVSARIEKALGKMKKGAASKGVKAPPPGPKERTVYLVNRPGSAQTEVYLGGAGIKRTDASYFSLYLANHVLGGGSSARLFKALRTEKGYTYGSYSGLRAMSAGGHWRAEVRGVEVKKSIPAIRDMLAIVTALPGDAMEPNLADAKSYLVGVFATSIETIGAVAGKIVDQKIFGLPADYWDTYNSKLAGVTEADAKAAASKFIKPAEAGLVVVGDATAMVPLTDPEGKPEKTLKEALRAFGKVEVYDEEGKKLETLEAVK